MIFISSLLDVFLFSEKMNKILFSKNDKSFVYNLIRYPFILRRLLKNRRDYRARPSALLLPLRTKALYSPLIFAKSGLAV